ncbi:MAG: LysO family transporter [Synergistales bacterium]|nr:LysO family transporter [Synergistales bacterium]
MDILIFMAFLALGITMGRSGRLPRLITDSLDMTLMVVIYGILLFVGIEVGTYRDVLSNLGVIGLKAVFLTFGTILGSGSLCLLLLRGE